MPDFWKTLKHLRDLGNTVIVVEHDEDAVLTADYVIDVGPGAGVHGGEVVAKGTPQEIMANPASLTGEYLSGSKMIMRMDGRRKVNKKKQLSVHGARGNNLQGRGCGHSAEHIHLCHRCLRRR